MEKEKAEIASLVEKYEKHGFKGEMYMVRYADDYVCLFQYEKEAQGFYQLMIERLKKFGLGISEDKSRIMPFGRYKGTKEWFDFLGFTHYNATSHWGKYCVLHRTSKKKLKMKREAIKKWIWEHMHESWRPATRAAELRVWLESSIFSLSWIRMTGILFSFSVEGAATASKRFYGKAMVFF